MILKDPNWTGGQIVTKTSMRMAFTELRNAGFTVLVFQTDKIKRQQEKGMSDIMIIDPKGIIIFVELKTKTDRVQESQKPLYDAVTNSKANNIIYLFAEEHNFRAVRDKILKRELITVETIETSAKVQKQVKKARQTKKLNSSLDAAMKQAIR